MNAFSIVKRVSIVSIIVVLLLIFSFSSYSFAEPAFAQGDDLKRAEIVEIAERYTNHTWNATVDNILHGLKFYANDNWQIDTPDAETQRGINLGGWWRIGQNVGVPYQWGGWSALDDADLNLDSDNDGMYFDEQLENGYAAGDINTNPHIVNNRVIDKSEYSNAAGVDCSGLISRAWRTHIKLGTSGLQRTTRPLKFADLRPGDILVTQAQGGIRHVVLFIEFLTEEKETPGTTRILVIESSASDWRVSEREYTLSTLSETSETWNGRNYTTDIVTLTRPGVTYANYSPRTYLNPIDIVLVIDRSGSMGTEKMRAAKEAAKLFVDLMRTGDKIGVVGFDYSATATYPLTEIDSEEVVKTAAKNAIDTLYARGNTSIGGGLQVGQNELNLRGVNAQGESDPVKDMVILSDGLENTAPFVEGVLPGIINDNIVVFSVGLGNDADQELLKSITDRTGGVYRFAPSAQDLWQIYNSILVKVYGERVVRTGSGTVIQGGAAEESVLVDSSIGSATFATFWPGSDLDLVLVQPDGSLVDAAVADADPNITFVSGATYEFYKVDAPQYGVWKLRILGVSTPSGGEHYSISVTATDAMIFTAAPDKVEYFTGNPIKITASIEDSYLDVITPQYILGATVEVTAQDPANNKYVFNLYDDGQHGDAQANDGIYTNVFTNTALVGSYNFKILVAGMSNRDSSPFTREESLSVVVYDQFNLPLLTLNLGNNLSNRLVTIELRYPLYDQQLPPLFTWSTVSDADGNISDFPLRGASPNTTYNLLVKPQGWLRTQQQVNLRAGQNGPIGWQSELDEDCPCAGDANGDNKVNIFDFQILTNTFGKLPGENGYDPRADFNGDNVIDIFDFQHLSNSFGKAGAGGEILTVASAGLAATSSIEGNLTLVPSTTTPQVGDVITLDLDFDTATLEVAALDAMIDYDQCVLEPVTDQITHSGIFATTAVTSNPGTLEYQAHKWIGVSPGSPVSGAGHVASIPFRVIAGVPSTTNLTIRFRTGSTYLSNIARDDIVQPILGNVGNTVLYPTGAPQRPSQSVQVISPSSGETINQNHVLLEAQVTDTCNGTINVYFSLFHDGQWHLVRAFNTGPNRWAVYWDASKVADQVIKVKAFAGDFAGNGVESPVNNNIKLDRPSTSDVTFDDVQPDYWASDFIERLYVAGITGGCSTNPLSYCPENQVTRSQMAVFLEKGVHYPNAFTAPNVSPTFSDTVGHWAENWIEALHSDGITSGCAPNMYCPEDPVTRAQMAVFLLKSKYGGGYTPPAVGLNTGFSDVPTSHWAAPWIKQLAAEGITGGCGTGIYCPESPVTRGQMAVFLVRTFNLP